MAKNMDDGGPAFPQPATSEGHAANTPWGFAGGGMTLRDYFAGQAMQGMLSDPKVGYKQGELDGDEVVAKAAVGFADALLAELRRTASVNEGRKNGQ